MRISDWSSDVCSSDLIEATAPARELPADLTAQQLQFVESLDVIYTVLHDADMLGQSIRSVMQELQENKEFIQLVSDHDIHTMIKAIRNVKSEEHTSELQSLMRISYAVFCLKKKKKNHIAENYSIDLYQDTDR